MRIVFYSTRSNHFDGTYIKTDYFPLRADEWDTLAENHPDCEFIVVAKFPATYLFDMKGNEISKMPASVRYVPLTDEDDAKKTAEIIAGLKPDAAVAVSAAGSAYDWNPIRDSVVAEMLEAKGVKTIAQKTFISVACFDKWRSNLLLRGSGFRVARAVYVQNDMFWVEKQDSSVVSNAYKEYILYRIRDLSYPVIVKSTSGSGSMGVTVVETPDEVCNLLSSEKNSADVIVEEIIQGEQFGTEIHGVKGHYHILPPFAFSTTEQGITDPYSSVKFGPVRQEKYQIKKLQKMLLKMAESFHFAGATQVDLVYRGGEWYVIEINPRWSGMTTTTAAAECRSPYEIYADCALGRTTDYSEWENLRYAVNFKIPEMDTEELARLYQEPGVKYIMETVAERPGKPKQAVCEVVLGGFETSGTLLEAVKKLREKYPAYVSEKVIASLSEMCQKYGDAEGLSI